MGDPGFGDVHRRRCCKRIFWVREMRGPDKRKVEGGNGQGVDELRFKGLKEDQGQ